jgi:hypothetical protein
MPLIQYDAPWTGQPPQSDRRPSRRMMDAGLVALFDVPSAIEWVSGARPTVDSSVSAVGGFGESRQFASPQVQTYAHRPSFAVVGDITLVALVEVTSVSSFGPLLSKSRTTSQDQPYEWRISNGGNIDLRRANASTASTSSSAAVLAPAGFRGSILSRTRAGGATVSHYVTNAAVSSSGSTPAPTDDGASTVTIGRRFDGGTQFQGRIFHIGLFASDIGDELARELVQDPWQLFEPRRIWVPVTAAGGGFKSWYVRPPSQIIGAGVR